MKKISYIVNLVEEIQIIKKSNLSIGFVPTMGALHQGHISLVRKCKTENDITIVSIFVNPIQFNEKSDLENYPRTLEKDLLILNEIGCDLVFIPSEKEMYPEPEKTIIDLNGLDKTMEGKYRKGHFNGVAIIVMKFFRIITPDKAYFGEKDFQQLTIIKYLVKILKIPVEIISCPIIRDSDGLALSSRNSRLTENQRKIAAIIPQTLFKAVSFKNQFTVEKLKKWVISHINANNELKVEYFEIVDDEKLNPVKDWNEKKNQIGCVAVKIRDIRLIDNIKFN